MAFTYRAFRKKYFRAKRAYHAIAKGSLTLSIRADADSQTATADCRTPDDTEALRFSLLMRPFIEPASDYHYRKLWSRLTRVAGLVSPEEVTAVDARIARIEAGQIGIVIDGQRVSAQDLYSLLARAEVFDADQDAQQRLQHFTRTPLFGPLIWFHFHSFSLDIYALIARFHQLAWQAQAKEPHRAPTPGKCLFCRHTDGPFTSEEHALPEALGNDETVLPRGWVCDPCNNRLSVLDQHLVEFPPIAALRVVFVAHDKQGRFPSAHFADGTWKRIAPRGIEVRTTALAPPAIGDEITLTVTGRRRFSPHLIARAVFKIAYELVAYRWGHEAALHPRYDGAREFIMGARRTFPGQLILATAPPHGGIEATIWPDCSTLVTLDVFGVRFIFTLEAIATALRVDTLPPDLKAQPFDLSAPPQPWKPKRQDGLPAHESAKAT